MGRAYVCVKISEYPPPPGVFLFNYTTVGQASDYDGSDVKL